MDPSAEAKCGKTPGKQVLSSSDQSANIHPEFRIDAFSKGFKSTKHPVLGGWILLETTGKNDGEWLVWPEAPWLNASIRVCKQEMPQGNRFRTLR